MNPTNTANPFVNGFSDENAAYDRYEPRYKAKNGRFDSLDELYMVRGVNDRFMAAFGDRLTIWPDINAKLNINTDDPQQMLTNILIAAVNPNDPSLRDPRLLQTILQEIQLRKMFSFFGMSAQDFVEHPAVQRNPAAAGDRPAHQRQRLDLLRLDQRHLPHHRHRAGGPHREEGDRGGALRRHARQDALLEGRLMHRTVGLDWAQDALRVATLQSGFRGFAIQDVRSVPLPAEGTPAERLKVAVEALGLVPPLGGDDTVAVALGGALVATHLVTLPFVDPKRIEQVLPAEVEGAIPFDLAEVSWDYAVLAQSGGKTDVLVGIVKKTALREHLAALEAAGIEPRVVTLAPLALAGLGEKNLLGGPPDPAAGPQPALTGVILDAGPDRADFALLDEGRPVLARALSTSGALDVAGGADRRDRPGAPALAARARFEDLAAIAQG